jgi:hypothetical protein
MTNSTTSAGSQRTSRPDQRGGWKQSTPLQLSLAPSTPRDLAWVVLGYQKIERYPHFCGANSSHCPSQTNWFPVPTRPALSQTLILNNWVSSAMPISSHRPMTSGNIPSAHHPTTQQQCHGSNVAPLPPRMQQPTSVGFHPFTSGRTVTAKKWPTCQAHSMSWPTICPAAGTYLTHNCLLILI